MAGVGLFVAAAFSLARNQAGRSTTRATPGRGMMSFGGTALGLIALPSSSPTTHGGKDLSGYSLGAGIAAVGVASSSTHWRSQTMPHFTAFWGWSRGFILLTVTFPMLITLRHRLHGLTTAPERPTVV